MPKITEEDINRVREKADIAEIIGRYIPLVKKGRNYAAVCPFHDDHDPSLSISTDKQIYKCFVCGNGGNVFTFVQNYEKISFPEAVIKVAEAVGVNLDYAKEDFIVEKYNDLEQASFKLYNEAIKYFSYQLFSSNAKEVLNYLHQRGYSDELIKTFDIGYCPDNDGLYKFLKAKGYSEKEMLSLNLIRSANDGFHDVFNRRIMFPIYNVDHKPIAFNGRASFEGQSPKYINSQETSLYVKGNVLYHYDEAKQYVKETGKVYVCEGVTDVYAFYRANIKNCVATLGTALSKNQIQLLKNLRCKIVLSYDGDNPGQAANFKNAKLLHDANLDVAIVRNETMLDPDEIIRQKSMESFLEILKVEDQYIEFVMRYLSKSYNFNNYSEKKEFCLKVIEEINTLKDNFDRKNFMNRLSKMTDFDEKQLNELIAYPSVNKISKNTNKPLIRNRINGTIMAESEIISQMLASYQAASLFKEELGFLPEEKYHKLAMQILDYYRKNSKLEIASFIDLIDDETIKKLVLDLEENDLFSHEYSEKALLDAFKKIKSIIVEEKIADLKKKAKFETSADVKTKLNEEIFDLKRQLLEMN